MSKDNGLDKESIRKTLDKYNERPKESEVTTSTGYTLKLKGVSLVDIEQIEIIVREIYEENDEPLNPPKYGVPTAGGGVLEKDMTAEWIEQQTTAGKLTETQQELWDAHRDAVERMGVEVTQLQTEIVFDGIEFEMPAKPILDKWVAKRKRRRFRNVPEVDSEEFRYYFLAHEVLPNPMDLMEVQQEIMLISSGGIVDREEIEAAKALFLNSIRSVKEKRQASQDDSTE